MLVVKGVDQLVFHQHVLPPRLVLQILHLFDEFLVGREEWQRGFPFLAHQRFADKNFARTVQVNPAVVHLAPAVDHDAVQSGPLQRHHLGGLLFPVRVEQLLLEQMPPHVFQPLWLDLGNATAEQARGFHQFGCHDPFAGLLGQVRAGVRKELDAACAQVFTVLPLFELATDIAQQARQHGQVQLLVAGGLGVQAPFVFSHHRMQLRVNVFPFPHTAHIDEVLAHELLILAIGQLVLARGARSGSHRLFAPRIVNPLPQLQVARELALLVIKLLVRRIRLLLRFHGPVAHILHAQRRGNHQRLVQRLTRAGLQQHPPHARVQRQAA